MDKTSQKVTKDPKHVEAGRKGRKNYMNKYKESILNDAKKGGDTTSAGNETTSATTNASNETTSATNTAIIPATTRSNDTYVYALLYLRPLPLVFVYFLHITHSLKIKNKPMKNRINRQNDAMCFRKIYNK